MKNLKVIAIKKPTEEGKEGQKIYAYYPTNITVIMTENAIQIIDPNQVMNTELGVYTMLRGNYSNFDDVAESLVKQLDYLNTSELKADFEPEIVAEKEEENPKKK